MAVAVDEVRISLVVREIIQQMDRAIRAKDDEEKDHEDEDHGDQMR